MIRLLSNFLSTIGWLILALACQAGTPEIGQERAVAKHLTDGSEFGLPLSAVFTHGKLLFDANWTEQEGGGRPMTKGTGHPLSDPSQPLTGSRAFNRISAPDANSCTGCHNAPNGISGGGGDFVTNVFVLGQRFDFATFDPSDKLPTRGAVDENGQATALETMANLRRTTGLFGAGYLEMLARQITEELQAIRITIKPGHTKDLVAKGIHFGKLTLSKTGTWDTSQVEGLPRPSLIAGMSSQPPTLVIRPWHQAANVVSIREFANNAFNQHHGIQSTERFGVDTDPDGDGFTNELTRADVTAVSVFQAALQVPGRVISRNPEIEHAVFDGERIFERIGCASCHIPRLPPDKKGWFYSEPNPYNPPTNLRVGETKTLYVDLSSDDLPAPRLKPDKSGPNKSEVVGVEAYTDFKLHDITDGDSIELPALGNLVRLPVEQLLPNRLDSRSPDLAIPGHQGQTERQSASRYHAIGQIRNRASRNLTQSEWDFSRQRSRSKGRTRPIYRQIQARHGQRLNATLLDQVSRFDHADGWDEDRLAVSRSSVQCFLRANGQARIGRQVPESRMRIGDYLTHSKNCSRGKLPHISLRASAMSSSDIEMPKSFQSPYKLFNGRFFLEPRKLAKSRTSCCCSGGSSRTVATIASSIGVAAISPLYRANRLGGIS